MEEVQRAIALMKAKGYKNTPKRQAMLEVIAKAERFITAKDVQEALKDTYKGLSYDTIYRNLYTFVEQGILESSERNGEKVFLMHCSTHKHHHHFICDRCEKITEIEMCPMDYFMNQLPGYEISGHRFEITGLCPECAKNKLPKLKFVLNEV
ncbi:transcriptional repressor [Granulicatella sp. zg-ZJ]|uniref:Fur family transcriptional regulator n=1 Tax=unclassified Granulicatella TaxID=2630493 RepID=UPI0013BF40B1|nr:MULTISPECIES: Fur family transcriptional regulator [unclassified Granulicatella]MBS4750060.1 transcriptional repressor [Carnobacteriaceae bacterium zg-ZUI78]NEW62639.1 transcriptional repressor [Granulicatella sp. zg-ZJ]NEW65784.1 transcriptional repressor [Granulicatella sp. zg-84]QMI86291.1 transcriptional repressor [Carnobacteriaceae bacterium zg-84]